MKTLILLLILGYFIADVKGQIGVTGCTVATQANCPNFLPNSYCNLGSLLCDCPAGYTATTNNVTCEYNCGALTDPDNGAVSTGSGTHTGDVAQYMCVSTFKVVGTATRTCIQDTGWDGAAPTCEPAEIGDACSTNIFQCNNIANGGCVAFSTCQCNAGYEDDGTGLACTEINDCATNTCQNGATCVDQIASYACNCVAGYDGNDCENNINECAGNPCQNGGVCTDGINQYTCACVPGYDGGDCQNNIDECTPNQCQNSGTCVDGINAYTCTCLSGYNGDNCENNIDDCATLPCQNGGTCQDAVNDYTCVCVAGYTDKNCQTNINECESHACNNEATCVDRVNAYECVCASGWEGTFCTSNIDECETNQCQNGAICVDGIDDYTCDCVNGYNGIFCQNNINECVGHACENGATCVDGINQYTCKCFAGYTGEFCATNIDECAGDPCSNGGTCVDKINDYTCNCVAGYTGKTCATNINDCATSPCQNGGACQDAVNDYTCVCVAGYTDKNCQTNINECESHACNNGATCVDRVNAYECVCASGWEGTFCTSNINKCVGHACENGATCVDGINLYTCTCVAGYTGEFCATNIDECDNHACLNGATCEDRVNKYTCTCVAGYADTFCQTNIDECSPNPCMNGATCVDKVNDYTCTCVVGYTDKDCQTNIDECDPDPCQNGATCVDGVNDYTCNCVAGYDGKTCSINIDECDSDPCQNGGTCVDEVDQYTCYCVPGYNGDECENNIDECIGNLCENGATCVDGINAYTCDCVPGYDDTHCEIDIDECASHSCQNSATCVDEINDYTCVCAAGYTETYCQTDINECASSPCQNGGTCTDQVNGYVCTCNNGFTGLTCRPGELGDDCSARAVVCDNLTNAECDGSICVCKSGNEDLTGATGSCSRVDCGTITPPTDGAVDHTSEGTDYESKAYFSCNAGYTLTGLSSVTCQADKSWSGATPTCVIKNCGDVAAILNGAFQYTPNTLYQGLAEFSCNTGYTLVGDATRTCQDTGVWGGANPVCHINDCGTIVAPANGNVDLTDGTTYESVAVFQCNNGYDMIGASSLECLADGSWDNAKPTCNIKDCGFLTNPANGAVDNSEGTSYLSNALFTCNIGYTLVGSSTRRCQASGTWSGTDPVCQINYCGMLSNPANGNVDISSGTSYGIMASYNCDGGFELNGVLQRTCQADGTWSLSAPTCDRLDCGTLTPPTDGAVDHTSEGTDYESKAYFSCNAGYTLTGLSSVTCKADKSWSGATPTCVIKNCGTVAAILNGAFQYTPNTLYQGLAEFSCNTGYTLVGDATRTCKDSGVWSGANPVCQIKDCGTIVAPANGNVDLTDGTTYESVAVFQCNNGYDMIGASSLECLADGSWDNAKPTCNIKDCGFLTNPAYGAVDNSEGTTYLSNALFTCNIGYTMVGSSTRRCQASGTWSGTDPVCQINDCEVLSNPAYGNVDISSGTSYGNTASYSCDAGFELNGVLQRTCLADSTWSSSAPTCDRLDCGNLKSPTSGSVNLLGGTLFEATAVFSCNPGYTLTGDSERYCTNTGDWDNSSPTCIIKDCGPLTDPENGQVLTVHGTTYNEQAEYSCNGGYQVNGVSTRTCEDDGRWSASDPTCEILDCGFVADIVNGGISYSMGTIYGSTVYYVCDNGYEVTGVASRVCLATGSWSANQPVCTILDIDECAADPCTNGGTCVDKINDYTCNCVAGYTDKTCATKINQCDGNTCQNGATCVDQIASYTCNCVPGYDGNDCENIKIEDVEVCTRDTDNRGTIWENTPVGLVVNNSCDEGFTGHITRACTPGGIWQLPVYNCIRDAVQNIGNVVDALSNTSKPEIFNTVLADIVSATVARENATEKLTNGEMKLLTTSLKTIATVLPAQLVINESILGSFFESVGNIIDNNNSDTWRSEQESTSAVQLVSAVDQISETLCENLQPGEKRNIRNANIALQAQTLAESKIVYPDENTDIEWLNTISSKIELQPQAFTDVTDQVIATAVVYRNLSGILPNTYSKNAGKGSSENNRINGAILAMTIPPEYSAMQLNPPISITFEHFDKTLSSPICVYWQKESESQGIWSDDGCELISTNNDVTVCECAHLTNFAVLMSPIKQTEESAWDLRIISMVCLSLSILCLVATIVLHFTFWKRLRSQRTTVMIHLCVCLIVAYLVFLIGINKTEHKKLCTAIAVFLHYIFLVVFGIMFLQGLQIVMAVQYVFKTRLNLKILLVMAWSLPAFIVDISIALSKLKGYGNKKLCWLTSDNWLIWSFVGPAIAVISFNAICLCLVIRAIFRTRAMQTKPVGKRVKTSIWALCVLLPLLGITWIVEVFYIDGNSEFLQYIFAILNGLQGFFIFLFHCALNRQVKKAMGEQRIKKVSKKFTQEVVV